MPKFIVTTSQTVYFQYEVEADSDTDAMQRLHGWLRGGDGLPDDVVFREIPDSAGDEEAFFAGRVDEPGVMDALRRSLDHQTGASIRDRGKSPIPIETPEAQTGTTAQGGRSDG